VRKFINIKRILSVKMRRLIAGLSLVALIAACEPGREENTKEPTPATIELSDQVEAGARFAEIQANFGEEFSNSLPFVLYDSVEDVINRLPPSDRRNAYRVAGALFEDAASKADSYTAKVDALRSAANFARLDWDYVREGRLVAQALDLKRVNIEKQNPTELLFNAHYASRYVKHPENGRYVNDGFSRTDPIRHFNHRDPGNRLEDARAYFGKALEITLDEGKLSSASTLLYSWGYRESQLGNEPIAEGLNLRRERLQAIIQQSR